MLSTELRIETFKPELELIKNPHINELVRQHLAQTPDYFFFVAASSSGKYHPKFAQGEGGLVRHTKAAVSIAKELLVLEQYDFSENEKDQIYAALILHDTYKAGKDSSEYDSRKSYATMTEHPVIAHDMIYDASDPDAATIADLIITHMGQWNTKYHSTEEIMPKPVTEAQKFVHLCDYFASRKIDSIIS